GTTLAAAAIAGSAIFLEITIVGVALPAIVRQFDVSAVAASWTVTAYTLALAAAVVPLGRLGDRIGRRRVLLWGLALRVMSSLACAAAPTLPLLILARSLQGLAAAALMPTTQALVTSAYPPDQRGRALGRMAGVQAVVFASGPVIGGALIAGPGWRWVFLVIAPLAAFAALLVWRVVPRDAAPRPEITVEPMPSLWLALAATMITLAGVEARSWGAVPFLSLLGAGLFCAWQFVRADARSRSPLLDPRLTRNPIFVAGLSGGFIYQFGLLSLSVVLLALFQTAFGMSASQSGLAFLPVSLPLIPAAFVVGPWVDRVGPRKPLLLGIGCVTVGIAATAALAVTQSYLAVLPGLLLVGIGIPLCVTPIQVMAVAHAPDAVRGLEGAALSLVRQIGGAIGVALLSTVAALAETRRLDRLLAGLGGVEGRDLTNLAMQRPGAQQALEALPAEQQHAVQAMAEAASVEATAIALCVGAGVFLLALALVARLSARAPSG
ncbi:MAG: MFS transporter, partial [Steroidobacteraceae bacterium]